MEDGLGPRYTTANNMEDGLGPNGPGHTDQDGGRIKRKLSEKYEDGCFEGVSRSIHDSDEQI